ncbi:ABC transporter permease [Fictibacillus nanhaiensis]|uniref:Transport permease protein n=1 Tax=Fictibacillus nanhaiensis TaxID=742169 RepID=A0ABS2ZPG9_9BACL|nr:ABC transporter permease [Fictibacillus nanhaiensis]
MFLTIQATFRRNYLVMRHSLPYTSIIGSLLSGFYMILFSYLIYKIMFNGKLDDSFIKYTGSSDYITFAVLGSTVYILSISVLLIVSRSLISELRQGTLETIFLSPASRQGYFLGCMLQGLMLVGIEFIGILVMGFFFGLDITNINPISASITLVLIIFSFYSQALVLGAIMVWFRDTYITQNTLITLMGLISGVSFPIEYLPDWLQYLSKIMPLTFGLVAFRETIMLGGELVSSFESISYLIMLTTCYFLIGKYLLIKVEKNILEKITE